MLFKLKEPEVFLRGVEIISGLVSEVRLELSDSGLSITAIDPANVALVNFHMPKESFLDFEVEKETLGINLDDLRKILRRASSSSSIVFERVENFLEISVQDKIKKDFKLSLIEVDSEKIDFSDKVSKMEFVTEVKLDSKDLSDSIEDCLVVADACSFSVSDKKFVIEAKNLNSVRSEFSLDEADISGEDTKSRYSLEYLTKFMKGSKLSERAILNFSDEHPLKISFVNSKGTLRFILAPRVEIED